MSVHLDPMRDLDFIQEKPLNELRKEKNELQSKIDSLWNKTKNDFKWISEHPEISLKTIALLDPNDQSESDTFKTLTVIVTKLLQEKRYEEVVRGVILDAIDEDNWDFIFTLLDAGVSPDLDIANGNTLLHLATRLSKEIEASELLIRGANPNTPNDERFFPLHIAAQKGLKTTCSELIKHKADINSVDAFRNTPLHYACKNSFIDVIEELLKKGASLEIANHEYLFCFHDALQEKNHLVLDCFVKSLTPLDWEMYQVYQWMNIENYDEIEIIINTWEESENEKEILAEVIQDRYIACCLVNIQSDWAASYIAHASLETMNHKIKLNLLPLLPPEEILNTLNNWELFDLQECLEEEVELEETCDGNMLTETVQEGLLLINEKWIEEIKWDELDASGYSPRLINDTLQVIERLSIHAFAAAVCTPLLCSILLKCMTILPLSKLAILVPKLDPEEFVQIAENLNHDEQCNLLRVATEEQKIAFLDEVKPEHSPIVLTWLLKDYHNLHRQLEKVVDSKMQKKDEYQIQAEQLVEDLERASAHLPTAVKHNTIRWERMLEALKTDKQTDKLKKKIKLLVESNFTQSKNITNQVEDLRKAIYEEGILGLSPPKEVEIQEDFLCGIYQTIMKNPVTAHGHTFDIKAISSWLENNDKCPICDTPIKMEDFKENDELKKRIDESGIKP